MKAEHVKTPEPTEEVSSDGMEKRVERPKSQRSALFAREKPRADLKIDLQTFGVGGKSPKRSTLVVGKKPYGKSRLKQIMALQVMVTPALVVDGSLKVAGRVPSVEEIKKLLA